MNRLFIAMAIVLTFTAITSRAMPDERSNSREKKHPVECEHYLSGQLAKKATRTIRDELLGPAFVFSDLEPVTKSAFAKLGLKDSTKFSSLILSVKRSETATFPIQVRLQSFNDGQLSEVSVIGFPDVTPTHWNTVWLSHAEMGLDHASINAKYPLRNDAPLIDVGTIGFQTDPDIDGASVYLRFRYMKGDSTFNVEAGLHVPCESLSKYVTMDWLSDNEISNVMTRATTMCRIPIITFSRPDTSL